MSKDNKDWARTETGSITNKNISAYEARLKQKDHQKRMAVSMAEKDQLLAQLIKDVAELKKTLKKQK